MGADLSDGAKVLDTLLCDYLGPLGQAWPGVDRLAADLAIDRRTVQRRLAELVAGGWFLVLPQTGRGHATRYTIDWQRFSDERAAAAPPQSFKENIYNPNAGASAPPPPLPWQAVAVALAREVGANEFRCWFAEVVFDGFDDRGRLRLIAPSRCVRDWITSRYGDRITSLMSQQAPQIRGLVVDLVKSPGEENRQHTAAFGREVRHG